MKAAPYGSYSSIEYEEIAGIQDGGRVMNPQRYHRFPTDAPNLQYADIDSGRTSDRSSLHRLNNSHPLNESGNLSQGTSPVPDWRRKNAETEGHMRNSRWNGEGAGYPKSNYQEGPSNYFHGSSNNRFGESQSHCNEYDAPKTFEYLERDRAELLRKLSELENQLVNSGSVGERGKQRHHVERSKYHHESFGSSGDWLHDNSSMSSSASRMANKHVTKFSPYPENHPYTAGHNVAMRDSYLSPGSSNDFIRHGDYVDSHSPRRGTHFTPSHYQEYNSSYPSHLPLQSAYAADPRILGSPHYYNSPLHQPDCSCYQCYTNKLKSPAPVQSRSSVNTRYTNMSSNPKFYHQKGAELAYNSPDSNSSSAMGGRSAHVRWPSELESTVDEQAGGYPQSTVPVKVKRRLRSIAGGAPFVTCSNCFELLQLRLGIIKLGNSQQKIQCGACSSFISFAVEGKGLVVSTHKESMERSKEMNGGSNVEEAKENIKDSENISNEAEEEMIHTRGPSRTSKSFQSDEFCCFVLDEGKGDLEQVGHGSDIAVEEIKEDPDDLEHISTEVEETKEDPDELEHITNEVKDTKEDPDELEHISTEVEETLSIHFSKKEDNKSLQCDALHRPGDESPLMDKVSVLKMPNSASTSNDSLDAQSLLSAVNSDEDNPEECATAQEELATADDVSDDLNLSPLSTMSDHQEQHGYSPSKHAVYWFGTHSQIIRAKNQEMVPERSTPKIDSVREISAETETEVSHDAPKGNISPDTKCGSNTEDPLSINDGGSFAESIKDRVIKLARSIQAVEDVECDVTINEHPIPDHLVKNAEDLAGPILPGNYWYDFRAGFWGVTGGPCLGIIPPRIKQFDYPISENCSGGTSGVIVNGRELHKKDLALLHSRGLPIERGKSYTVEISGRVLDKDSGEELNSLGQLAPTIERLKRGFGMKVRR
ncbi:unnamed protein product [Rhodiola kirilowii]